MANHINNPLGFGGYTDFQTLVGNIAWDFKTSAAVTAKYCVALGSDGTVAHAATDSTAAGTLGIALESAASGDMVKVAIFGAVDNVPVAGTVTEKLILKRSVTTTGYLSATATPVAGEAIGFAIAASASNVADVWISKAL